MRPFERIAHILVNLAFLQVAIMDIFKATEKTKKKRYYKLKDTWEYFKPLVDQLLEENKP